MIKKPTLLINEKKCRNNIKKMADKASRHNLIFRPHFKTHQSLEIGRWYKEFGVDRITVSSVSMAEYFSGEWNNITIAFSVNLLEINEINSLSERISLNLLVESEESALFLKDKIKNKNGIFIKIDTGYHRTGIDPENISTIDRILDIIESSEKLIFKGFLSHAGHTYNCRSKSLVKEITGKSIGIMRTLKKHYVKRFPDIIVSLGDTPGCSITDDFQGIDEIRPGNFIFYDLSQVNIGSAEIDDISTVLVCPVVSVHKERNEIIIYGGGVHFSKDSLKDDKYGIIYGKAVAPESDHFHWKKLIPDMYVKKLSQEHGVVHASDSEIIKYKPGDLLYILPVHSCMTANLIGSYLTETERIISRI